MSARIAGPARAVSLAAVLAVVASVLVTPFLTPARVQAMGPLPACRYDNLLTAPRRYADWSMTLVDTILRVPAGYEPTDLVPVSRAGIPGKGLVRALVIDDLRALTDAAAAADAAIGVQSAYRSYDRQREVFDDWVAEFGRPRALQVSARPGHSEHQLGLGIDFRSDPGGSPFEDHWEKTAAGKWMNAHAWEFGFVMSYPKGELSVVCYDFEPWHFRYVGRDMAAAVHDSGLTLREYLWANFTTIGPTASTSPGTSAEPSPGASSDPTASSSPSFSPGAPSALPPSAVPASPPGPTGAPTELTPPATAVPVDGGPGVGPETTVVAGFVAAFGGILALSWMVLRRGRSRLGL